MNAPLAAARRAVRGRRAIPGILMAVLAAIALAAAGLAVRGQPASTVPPDGLREHTPAVHALVGARVVLAPGRTIERGTVIVRDGAIVAVGSSGDIVPPPDARV